MIYFKDRHVISIVVVFQMLTSVLGYILLGPPYRPQYPTNYIVGGAIRVVKPPDLSSHPSSHSIPHYRPSSPVHHMYPMHPMHYPHQIPQIPQIPQPTHPPTPQYSSPIDFRKPKTQTFFRAALIPSQSPVYEFGYKVHDPKEQNFQTKSEVRVGDAVKGSYSVLEPNGFVRMVKYLSDENGFRTQVSHHHQDENGGDYSYSMTRS